MEKLAKDLNSIMHKEQLCYLSGSLDEHPLYHSDTVGSFEIGYGSGFLGIQTQNHRRKIGKQALFLQIRNNSLQVNHIQGCNVFCA
jgi:hypothetical protein